MVDLRVKLFPQRLQLVLGFAPCTSLRWRLKLSLLKIAPHSEHLTFAFAGAFRKPALKKSGHIVLCNKSVVGNGGGFAEVEVWSCTLSNRSIVSDYGCVIAGN